MSGHQDALTLEGIVAQPQFLQGCALGEIRDQACTVNPKVSWIDVCTSRCTYRRACCPPDSRPAGLCTWRNLELGLHERFAISLLDVWTSRCTHPRGHCPAAIAPSGRCTLRNPGSSLHKRMSYSAGMMCGHQVLFTPDNPLLESLISVTRPLWSKVTPAGLHAAASPSVIVGSSLSQPSLFLVHFA